MQQVHGTLYRSQPHKSLSQNVFGVLDFLGFTRCVESSPNDERKGFRAVDCKSGSLFVSGVRLVVLQQLAASKVGTTES